MSDATEPLYVSASGTLGVRQIKAGHYQVVHIGTGLFVPTRTLRKDESGNTSADLGTYRETWKYKGETQTMLSDGWRTKIQAKKYMEAIEATGLLTDYPEDREERAAILRKLQDWMETLAPAETKETRA